MSSRTACAPPRRASECHVRLRPSARSLVLALALMLVAGRAGALSDEIDVYTAEIAAPGVLNLTLHNNYLANAGGDSRSIAGPAAYHSLTGGSEWAYGAAPWLELGVYAPIYTLTRHTRLQFDGAEVRALFVTPHAEDRSLFYGLNLALQINEPAWDPDPLDLEIRPILGGRFGHWRVTINPIVDLPVKSPGSAEFAPAARLDFGDTERRVGVELYIDDTGTVSRMRPWRQQNQRLFLIGDLQWDRWSFEPGVGLGITTQSDHLTIKLIVSRDLNP